MQLNECDHDVVILLISLHNTQFIVIKFAFNLTNYRLQNPENKKDIIKNQTFSLPVVLEVYVPQPVPGTRRLCH